MYYKRILSLLSLGLGFVGGAPAPTLEAARSIEPRGTTYPSASGRLFNIAGKTQYFSGTNAWYLSHLTSNADVNQAMSQIAAVRMTFDRLRRVNAYFTQAGLKTVRVWGFGTTNNAATEKAVYFQVLNSSGQYFNMDANTGIGRLDYAVSAAKTYGIQLVLPLLNNFDALGGINTYINAYGGTHNSFYTDAKSQAAYKNYIKFIVNRYKTSTAIFSWELCNEPRCSGCASSVITNWATSISAYIKSLDANHMVSLGDEGWLQPSNAGADGSYAYSGYEGVDFAKNLAIKTIDYGTFHLYADQWGYSYSWGNTWISQHNAIGKAAGKPVVLEEYTAPTAALREQYMPQWQSTVLSTTSIASDSFWQFATTYADGTNPYDEYALYYNATAGSHFQKLGTAHAKAMAAKQATANI